MKKSLAFVFMVLMSLTTIFAQKDWETRTAQNISIKAPNDWLTNIQGEETGDLVLTLYQEGSECFVEITCLKKVMTPNTRATDIASRRSNQPHFEYMQIDKVQSAKFQKHNAKLLTYTNTYLNEVCKGGIYCFNAEGYTYTVEYFGEDNPTVKKMLEKIINTFAYNSPEKERNIVEKEKDYVAKDWNVGEDKDEKAEKELAKAEKKAEKEAKKEAKKQEKLLKEQEKEEKELKKEQKKAEKAQKEAEKAQKKLEKEEKKAKKEAKKQQKAEEKAAKENKEKQELIDNYLKVKNEIDELEKENSELTKDFVKAQNKNNAKKANKIAEKMAKLAEKRVKLNEKLAKAEAKCKKEGIKTEKL